MRASWGWPLVCDLGPEQDLPFAPWCILGPILCPELLLANGRVIQVNARALDGLPASLARRPRTGRIRMPCEKPIEDRQCPSRAYQLRGDNELSSWPTQVTIQGQQSIELHDEAVLLTGSGSRTRRLSRGVHD